MSACLEVFSVVGTGFTVGRGHQPHSEAGAAGTIALPVYPELTRAQQELVVTAVVEFVGKHACRLRRL